MAAGCNTLLFTFVFLLLAGTECLAQLHGSLTPGNNFQLGGTQRIAGNNHENMEASLGLGGNTNGVQGNWNLDYNKGRNSAGIFGSHSLPGPDNTVGARGNLNLFSGQKDRFDVSAFGSQSTNNVKQFGTGLHFNEHSFSATRTNQPGAGSQTRLDGSANLFKTPSNRLDLNAFKSRTQPVGSPSFGSHGAGLNWNNANGHGASAGFDRTPAIKETNLYARGRANLWQSKNRQTSLDAFGSASRTVSGPRRGNTNYNAGFGLSHRF
ncbi:AAEL003389-PA [Aedes aegypti]|uniref:AAEL003389-PA n=2 Tax=Aedes aegypti TaxID=7159 RepID=A0A1S4F4U5_AEDAE|nr:attacin-B [Aedes aegypti]EAT45361.1 AAEL003389-PA [Aedes aegypti]